MSLTRVARTLLVALLLSTAPLVALSASAAPAPMTGPAPPHTLSAPGNDTNAFTTASGPAGDAVALWVEQNTSTYSLWTARFAPASGWGPGSLRAVSTAGFAGLFAGVGPAGQATLFWVEYTDPATVWFALDSASGLGAPTLLHTASQYFQGYWDAAMGPDGSTFVFWTEYNGSAGSSDHLAAVIEPDGDVVGPDIMAGNRPATFERTVLPDPSGGGATALWCDRTGPNANLTESHYAPGMGWSTPTVFAPNLSNGCSVMDAAIDGAGNITVIASAFYYNGLVTVARPAGGPWGTPQLLWNASGRLSELDVVLVEAAADGRLAAAWRINGEPFDTSDLYAVGFVPGSGWSALQHPVSSSITAPRFLLSNSAAGGVLVYPIFNGSEYVLEALAFSSLPGCGGWSAAAPLGLGTFNPNILAFDLAPAGAGHVLFHAWDGSVYRLYATDVAAPTLAGTLAVVSPPDGYRTTAPVAVVSGTTVPGSTVSVQGLNVAAGSDGSFSAAIALVDGVNAVQVTASLGGAYAGCSVSTSLTITFDDPLPVLAAELNATRAQLDAALARLAALEASGNATQADLDAALADLAAANETIERMKGDFSRATLNLTETQEELERVKVQFPWLEANVTAGQAQVASLSAQLEEAESRALLAEAQQNQTANTLRQATADNAALAGQVAVLSVVAFAALIAGVGAIGVSLVMARRAAGGGGEGPGPMHDKPRSPDPRRGDEKQE